jgi:hypothetical protein
MARSIAMSTPSCPSSCGSPAVVGCWKHPGANAAALALRRRADRLAGVLLMLSVATPTYFAYVLNLPALMIGLALAAMPSLTLGDRQDHVDSAV